MMNLVLVMIGGGFGSICRYWLGKYIAEKGDWVLPLGTFVINITGAIFLGLLVRMNLSHSYVSLLGEGFLGAYTTFSTFAYEGYKFFEEGFPGKAILYMFGSLIVGVAGFALGFRVFF